MMNPDWQILLEEYGARIALDDVSDFGNPEREILAARDGTVVVPLSHLGLIRASGEDATGFLHNLTSNDIRKLSRESAEYSSLNTAKGRMLASFLVWRDEDDYLLALSRDLQPAVQKKLSMYILRSKVRLADDAGGLVCLGIAGPGAVSLLQALGVDAPVAPLGIHRFARGAAIRLGEARFLLALRAEEAPDAWKSLADQACPAGTPVWRWLEIRAGIPRVTVPTQEAFVPQMANLDLIGGISFTKGCYPGQEIVARTRYLGKIKRRMYLAHVEAQTLPGQPVHAPETGEQPCGMVVDAVPAPGGGMDLLAVIQTSCAEGGDVRVGHLDGAPLRFLPLPYPLEPDR